MAGRDDAVMLNQRSESVIRLFTRAAPTYGSVGPPHFTYFARRLVDFVGVAAGDRVLDVATGTAAARRTAERAGRSVQLVGIDLTPAMLQLGRREAGQRGVAARLCMMDAERLAFGANFFDVVLCSFAFLSISDKQRALLEFRRVLAPGARVGVPDAFGWFFEHDSRWEWQRALLASHGVLGNHRTAENGSLLETMLRDAGYASVQVRDDAFELVFRDADEWWRWVWSHGSRGLFEAVPRNRRRELKTALYRGLAACVEED
ncbi:MAG: methyltransferase domain-containing protein [Chloroflexi bacterium]|nr:methyltransferase domain-containing protein [Chloroflexota bacterium]